jgi:hypothetical protein
MDHVIIETGIWKSPEFTNLPRKQKLLCFFLRTNDSVSVSGIYPLPLSSIEKNIWTTKTHAVRMLRSLPGIEYDFATQFVFIRDHFSIAKTLVPDPESKVISEKAQNESSLWLSFLKCYPEMRAHLPLTPEEAREFPPDRSDEPKATYALHVSLTPLEYARLGEVYGEAERDRMIQKHNSYKSTTKREYSSDYAVILRYVAERVKGEKEKELAEGGLKTRYAGHVWLRAAEYARLCSDHTKSVIDRKIADLDAWKTRKCLDVGNDAARLAKWVNRDTLRVILHNKDCL